MKCADSRLFTKMDNNDRKPEGKSSDGTVAAAVHHQQRSTDKGRKSNDPLPPLPVEEPFLTFTDPEPPRKANAPGKQTKPMAAETNSQETIRLPATFAVKFLGKREARGLWGIKYTRKPVDDMVAQAKVLKPGTSLPFLHFKVAVDGVTVSEMPDNRCKDFESGFYPVDIISYGVQDLIYTRVFSMIIVRDTTITPSILRGNQPCTPFECYAYVCDSRQSARSLTIALATAFSEFSKTVKNQKMKHKLIAIDLRTPEQMAAELEDQETEA